MNNNSLPSHPVLMVFLSDTLMSPPGYNHIEGLRKILFWTYYFGVGSISVGCIEHPLTHYDHKPKHVKHCLMNKSASVINDFACLLYKVMYIAFCVFLSSGFVQLLKRCFEIFCCHRCVSKNKSSSCPAIDEVK